jgi:hypothetical protein
MASLFSLRHLETRWLALTVFLGLALPASAQLPPDLQGASQGPPPVCYLGYLDFEAAQGLEGGGIRAAIRRAVEQNDQPMLSFLAERLKEHIGESPFVALKVVGWMEEATTAPELTLYQTALGAEAARKEPAVASKLISLVEENPDPLRQTLALLALESQDSLPPEPLARLSTLAKQETASRDLALKAVRAMGRVMENDFRRTGRFEPYMQKLLEIARTSKSPQVRSLAVEMGGYPDARLDAGSVAGLAELMKTDPDPLVREMAALVLSSGRDTQAVLQHFREAFPAEKERCARWALLRYAVRAGGVQALPLVHDFAKVDRRFQQDAAEFQRLYDAGYVDFNHVWVNLTGKERHPTCEGGEP